MDLSEAKAPIKPSPSPNRGVRFWAIIGTLCLLSFVSTIDVAVITTSLPSITKSLGSQKQQYVWLANSFPLASTVFQPLYGQLADVFGRRNPLIISIVLFTLGSGLAGGANDVSMHIAGRVVQGIGAGALYVYCEIVCCDLVPLRERGKYLGFIFSFAGVAAALGPVVGGALTESNWRWIFYLNIPICAAALVAVLVFMRVKSGQASSQRPSVYNKLSQVDWIGNLIFTTSMTALLYGAVTGGIEHPWSDYRVVLPIVFGCLGWVAFHVHQRYVRNPSVPPRLFGNRTSAICFFLTFSASVLVQIPAYFLAIYFQAVQTMTVLQSGINFLPMAIGTLAFGVVGGVILSKFGAYRPFHALAFGLSSLGFALFTLLDANSGPVTWVCVQLLVAAESGILLATILPAIMAALSESDVAAATAVYLFVRCFGYIWGITIPSVIFNDLVNKNLDKISDPAMRLNLIDGGAYGFASRVHSLKDILSREALAEIKSVYFASLKPLWWVAFSLSCVTYVSVWFERQLELRQELETDYGLDDDE